MFSNIGSLFKIRRCGNFVNKIATGLEILSSTIWLILLSAIRLPIVNCVEPTLICHCRSCWTHLTSSLIWRNMSSRLWVATLDCQMGFPFVCLLIYLSSLLCFIYPISVWEWCLFRPRWPCTLEACFGMRHCDLGGPFGSGGWGGLFWVVFLDAECSGWDGSQGPGCVGQSGQICMVWCW